MPRSHSSAREIEPGLPPGIRVVDDGAPATIRRIRAADLALAIEFVDGLSPHSRYQRFLSARTPSLDELRRFTNIDPEREGALVATVHEDSRERQVGVARYVKGSPSEHAEFALVVSDDWQRRGLGTRLLRSLVAAAREHGVQRLMGSTLSTNEAMLALGRKLGFRAEADPRSATITQLTLEL